MILGIGVDTVDIDRIRRMLGEEPRLRKLSDGAAIQKSAAGTAASENAAAPEEPAFFRRVFSERERAAAPQGKMRVEYYAARFAVKEAVFKAVAHLLPEKHFDLREVESLHDQDGRPYVAMDGPMEKICSGAGVAKIHISVTTEGHYATAFAVAEDGRF
ncbi:MAG: holo-ACP synthase [Lachnospiraceae bacterium]|nr:holo-ACP synthase [Lachnospiraceae bacterium]